MQQRCCTKGKGSATANRVIQKFKDAVICEAENSAEVIWLNQILSTCYQSRGLVAVEMEGLTNCTYKARILIKRVLVASYSNTAYFTRMH